MWTLWSRSGVSINITEQRKKIGPVLALHSVSCNKSFTSAVKVKRRFGKRRKMTMCLKKKGCEENEVKLGPELVFVSCYSFNQILTFFWYFFLLFPASSNRKTFKSSVKPGWYYFGRKMVRDH